MGVLLSRGFCTPYADEGVPALVAVLINPASCRRLVIPFIGATLAIPGRSSSRSLASSSRTEHIHTRLPPGVVYHLFTKCRISHLQ